jgi:hypothetical protein
MGVLFAPRTPARRDYMDNDFGVENIPANPVESTRKKLADLYARRLAVEGLIRCLESYAACQAKPEDCERLDLKRA